VGKSLLAYWSFERGTPLGVGEKGESNSKWHDHIGKASRGTRKGGTCFRGRSSCCRVEVEGDG